jgi:hypothetical protein
MGDAPTISLEEIDRIIEKARTVDLRKFMSPEVAVETMIREQAEYRAKLKALAAAGGMADDPPTR